MQKQLSKAAKRANTPRTVSFAVKNFSDLPDDAGLTISDVAQILNIGISTTWAWIKAGRLPEPDRLGRTRRIRAGKLRRVIAGASQ